MQRDRLGLELTAANADAALAYDETLWAYVSFARDPGALLKRALQVGPGMPMTRVLSGYFNLLMGVPKLLEQAQAAHAAAAKLPQANARERGHIEALGVWCDGEYERATAILEGILADHPHDLLALKVANYLYFYMGDAANVRDGPARVLDAWDEGMPGYGHLLALHAFGLEESGDYAAAEDAGRRATVLNPADPWAVHSVAHVMEMQDRCAEGAAWIDSLAPHWEGTNFFRFHLWWHLALLKWGLERHDEALDIYDARVWGDGSNEALSLCNDISLLARLELAGVHVGGRWDAVAAAVRDRSGGTLLPFAQAHYALATGEMPPKGRATTGRVQSEVGRALCEAMIAWRAHDYARTVDLLAPVRPRLWRIGGSHAQRDLFTLILLDSALQCSRTTLARALLSERGRLRANGRLPARLTAIKE